MLKLFRSSAVAALLLVALVSAINGLMPNVVPQSVMFPGPGGAGRPPVVCGNAPAFPSGLHGANETVAGYAFGANPCTPSGALTVSACGAYFAPGSAGNVVCAIYADNGLSGVSNTPTGAPLCKTTSQGTVPGAGFLELDLTTAGCPVLNAGSRYWVMWNTNNAALNIGTDAGGPPAQAVFSSFAFPNFPTSPTWTNWGTYATLDVYVRGNYSTPLWTPAGTGTSAWWKADAITGLADGAAVASWVDASGNGYTASNATTSQQPIYKVNIQNNLPVVRFSQGAPSLLNIPVSPDTTETLALVYQLTTNVGGGLIEAPVSLNGTLELDLINGIGGYTSVTFIYGGSGTASGWNSPSALLTTGFHTIIAQYAGGAVSTTSNYSGSYDGTLQTVGGSSNLGAGATGDIGGRATTAYLNGDIAEMVVYPSSINANRRTCLEGYLAWKWAEQANLPAGHPYKSAAPTTASTCN